MTGVEGGRHSVSLLFGLFPAVIWLQYIMSATEWQAYGVRGFISGNLTKKMGITVESTKNDAGERTYRTAK
jgi:hypothetical protein